MLVGLLRHATHVPARLRAVCAGSRLGRTQTTRLEPPCSTFTLLLLSSGSSSRFTHTHTHTQRCRNAVLTTENSAALAAAHRSALVDTGSGDQVRPARSDAPAHQVHLELCPLGLARDHHGQHDRQGAVRLFESASRRRSGRRQQAQQRLPLQEEHQGRDAVGDQHALACGSGRLLQKHPDLQILHRTRSHHRPGRRHRRRRSRLQRHRQPGKPQRPRNRDAETRGRRKRNRKRNGIPQETRTPNGRHQPIHQHARDQLCHPHPRRPHRPRNLAGLPPARLLQAQIPHRLEPPLWPPGDHAQMSKVYNKVHLQNVRAVSRIRLVSALLVLSDSLTHTHHSRRGELFNGSTIAHNARATAPQLRVTRAGVGFKQTSVDAGVHGRGLEARDAEELVVLGSALRSARSTGLDDADAQTDDEVRDGHVLGLTGAVRHHDAPVVRLGELRRLDRLGDGADLVDLEQQTVARLLLDGRLDAQGVGDRKVVADDGDAGVGAQVRPRLPVVLVEGVLDRGDRVLLDEAEVDVGELLAREPLGRVRVGVLEVEVVLALLVELGRG
ncbi:hypothetical protein Golomagni_06272, partial [Golovinomyces magnicellulatus]